MAEEESEPIIGELEKNGFFTRLEYEGKYNINDVQRYIFSMRKHEEFPVDIMAGFRDRAYDTVEETIMRENIEDYEDYLEDKQANYKESDYEEDFYVTMEPFKELRDMYLNSANYMDEDSRLKILPDGSFQLKPRIPGKWHQEEHYLN